MFETLRQISRAGSSASERVFRILRGTLQLPSGRRLLLASNVLLGNPTMYRIDIRDGELVMAGSDVMVSECTVTHRPPAYPTTPPAPSSQLRPWRFGA